MQIPFPSENRVKSMPKKDLLLPYLNKNLKIQVLISKDQTSLETLPRALYQTMAVTDKERHKASGIGHRAWSIGIGSEVGGSLRFRLEAARPKTRHPGMRRRSA
jgi:hypothetical protein